MARISWETDLTAARERAQREQKPLLVDVTRAPD